MIIDVAGRFPLVDTTYRWEYDKADIDEDAIHHTATLFEAPDLTPDQELAHLDVIYHYHVNYRGFGGIGYHGVSFRSGRRYRTAPWDRIGANVQFENDHLRGWAAGGLFDGCVPPQPQLEGLAELILEGWRDLGREVPAVPHLKYGGTSCPGDRWREWVPGLADLARQLRRENEEMATPEEVRASARATTRYLRTGRVTSGLAGPPGDRDDPDFPHPEEDGIDLTFQAILDAISRIPTAAGVRITDAQLTRVLTPIVRKALRDMATKAGG